MIIESESGTQGKNQTWEKKFYYVSDCENKNPQSVRFNIGRKTT